MMEYFEESQEIMGRIIAYSRRLARYSHFSNELGKNLEYAVKKFWIYFI